MNRIVKILLAAFISVNFIGGTFLGLFEYKKENDAKVAFSQFYGEAEVKGATTTDQNNGLIYLEGVLAVVILAVSGGVLYNAIHRVKLARRYKSKIA